MPTVAELLMEQGRILAAQRMQQGAIQGQMWHDVGQTIAQIPGQIVGAQVATANNKLRAAELTTYQQQQATRDRQVKGQQVLADAIKQNADPQSGQINHEQVASTVSQAGYPDLGEAWLKTASSNAENLDKLQTLTRQHQQLQLQTIGDMAYQASTPQEFTASVGLLATQGLIDEPTAHRIAATAATDEWKGIKEQYQKFSPLYRAAQAELQKPMTAPQGAVINTPARGMAGQPPLISGQPKPPTEAEIALQAAGGSPQGAMAILKPTTKAPGSLEEQLLTALTNGDQATADRITSTMTIAAKAKKDPAAEALATQLHNLSAQEAEQRLKKLQEENAPVDVSPNIRTTVSGRQYLPLEDFQTPAAKEKARKDAEAKGVIPVNKDTGDALIAADTARTNLQSMLAQVGGKLPKDPQGRIIAGPKNKLSQYFQTDADLAAWGSWRTAAIQAVQALAEKGMGLRLNRAEIDLMLNNDIPQITDTYDTAKQRVANLFTMLDNKEKGALVRDRSAATPTPTPATPTPTGPKVGDVVTYQGKHYRVTGITNGQADLQAVP